MQEPGRRQFAGVDLRRPKGYPAASTAPAEAAVVVYGDPCPRCESRDTKFCYYNNYNASQPRHYCKSCRRYWTKGGSLRDVPVGGRSRKSSSSSSSPKRAKSSKRRRVGSAAPPEPGTSAADAAMTAEAGATVEDSPDHPSVALGLGVADETGGKELPDPSPFEWPWPSGCDLWSFGSPGMFADTDPALFLDCRESWSIEPDSGS